MFCIVGNLTDFLVPLYHRLIGCGATAEPRNVNGGMVVVAQKNGELLWMPYATLHKRNEKQVRNPVFFLPPAAPRQATRPS